MSKFYSRDDVGAIRRAANQEVTENERSFQGVVRSAGFGGLLKVQLLGSGTYVDVQSDTARTVGETVLLYRKTNTNRWQILSANSDAANSTIVASSGSSEVISASVTPPATVSAFGGQGFICCHWTMPDSAYNTTYEIEVADNDFISTVGVKYRVAGSEFLISTSPQYVTTKYFRVRTLASDGSTSDWSPVVTAASLVDQSVVSLVTYHCKWKLSSALTFGGTLNNDSRLVNFDDNLENDLFTGSSGSYFMFTAPADATYNIEVGGSLGIISTSSHIYSVSVIDVSTNTVLQTIFSQTVAATSGTTLVLFHAANLHLLSGQRIAIRLRYDELADGDNTLNFATDAYVDISWQGVRTILPYQVVFVPDGGDQIELCSLEAGDTIFSFWVRPDGQFADGDLMSIGIDADHELLADLTDFDLTYNELHFVPKLYKASGNLSVILFCDNSSGETRTIEIGIDAKLQS